MKEIILSAKDENYNDELQCVQQVQLPLLLKILLAKLLGCVVQCWDEIIQGWCNMIA